MTIRTIIVDDEELARRGIKSLLNRFTDVEVIAECCNGREAIDAIRHQVPDLVFLDVQMPGKNGFEVMAECGELHRPYVIFVTAYDQYAIQAFDVDALDYVLKPLDEQRFTDALGRARRELARARDDRSMNVIDRITVKANGKLVVLKLKDIDWVEAEQDYVSLHVGSKTYLLRDTIAALEEQIAPAGFVRIHRSTLLNVDRVRELHPLTKGEYTVILHNGTELKLSRNYRDAVEKLTGYGV
jgi:two-component system, LytTR family, response regulator